MLNQRWSLFVAIGATFAAIEIPLRLVLSYPLHGVLMAMDWGLTLIFFLDMLLYIRRAGWITGQWFPGPQPARITPYSRWWVVIDVLAVIPFSMLPVLPQFLLFRLLKLARVAELMRRWRQIQLQNTSILRLLFFLFWLALSVHWISCGWLALRGISPEFDTNTNYLRALYWCVTTVATVGYGDITPTTDAQMLYTIAVMMFGAGVYGYVIANVASILANIDPARVRHREIVEKINAFMKYRNIPAHLQHRIHDYYNYLWEKRLGYDESAAISALPPSLRADISLFLNRDIIEKVPLFRGASEEFIRSIALQMRPVIFTPGDYIMRAGEPGSEMYFISQGTVEVVSADGQGVYATLTTGDFFGEIALLLNQPRTASVRAVDYCDLYMLEKETFDRILTRFPDFAAHIEEMARKRQERNNK